MATTRELVVTLLSLQWVCACGDFVRVRISQRAINSTDIWICMRTHHIILSIFVYVVLVLCVNHQHISPSSFGGGANKLAYIANLENITELARVHAPKVTARLICVHARIVRYMLL